LKGITEIFIETTLRKTIDDIKDTPKRSIRNLVDLALNFAKGRFQKSFLKSVQKMLQDEHSSYYDLILDTVYNVDTERLITFGMNVGYNGCTQGAKKIREIESTLKYNIPWSVSLEIDGKSYLDNEDKYFEVVEQGKNLGICTWQIFADRNVKSVLSLANKHSDCGFIFFCAQDSIEDDLLDEAESLYNIMFAVRYDEDMSGIISKLRERKMMYSIYIPYGDKNIKNIISDDFYEGILDLHPIFTVLLPDKSISDDSLKEAYQYVTEIRKEQTMPTVLWDAYSDSKFIDSVISEDACLAAFDRSGSCYTKSSQKDINCNIFKMPLAEIFKILFPKQ